MNEHSRITRPAASAGGDSAPADETFTLGGGDPALRARRRKQMTRRILLIVVPIVAVVAAVAWWLHGGRYEVTDNAYVRAASVSVSANIPGRVVAVEVQNNQRVAEGDVLFRIDPAAYQSAVDEAEATLAAARLQVQATRADYSRGLSELQAAQDRLDFAERELARQKELVDEGISSQARYEEAQLAAVQARQAIQTAQRQNDTVLASLAGQPDLPVDQQPEVKRAQAALESARILLEDTVIRAAQDGVVTRVDQLQVGDYVNASQPVFSLVGQRFWIEANFKENQLTHMRLGQPARVEIDAFPDLDLTGRVASFSPGTGASFSVLPAENATGNWVKVVQRLPVDIDLDDVPADAPLFAGLSAKVRVETGHQRRLFGN